jgi:hypothetical protein
LHGQHTSPLAVPNLTIRAISAAEQISCLLSGIALVLIKALALPVSMTLAMGLLLLHVLLSVLPVVDVTTRLLIAPRVLAYLDACGLILLKMEYLKSQMENLAFLQYLLLHYPRSERHTHRYLQQQTLGLRRLMELILSQISAVRFMI